MDNEEKNSQSNPKNCNCESLFDPKPFKINKNTR